MIDSAQAAQARLERARNSPILPGRSQSVVRVFLRVFVFYAVNPALETRLRKRYPAESPPDRGTWTAPIWRSDATFQ